MFSSCCNSDISMIHNRFEFHPKPDIALRSLLDLKLLSITWSELQDSNLRPSAPKADALPDCAKLRNNFYLTFLKYSTPILLSCISSKASTQELLCTSGAVSLLLLEISRLLAAAINTILNLLPSTFSTHFSILTSVARLRIFDILFPYIKMVPQRRLELLKFGF